MTQILEFVAAVVRNLPTLSVEDMQFWIKKPKLLAAALAKVLKPEATTVASQEHILGKPENQTIIVQPDLPLATSIAAGKYDHVDKNLTEQNFPYDPSSVGEWEWRLVHFGRNKSSEAAVTAAEVDGWIVAKLPHLLAFGAQYPEEQRKYPVVALGSSCTVDGDRRVPSLWSGDVQRNLRFSFWNGDWNDSYRFLVVRPLRAKIIDP